jgi:hypothetical protein
MPLINYLVYTVHHHFSELCAVTALAKHALPLRSVPTGYQCILSFVAAASSTVSDMRHSHFAASDTN